MYLYVCLTAVLAVLPVWLPDCLASVLPLYISLTAWLAVLPICPPARLAACSACSAYMSAYTPGCCRRCSGELLITTCVVARRQPAYAAEKCGQMFLMAREGSRAAWKGGRERGSKGAREGRRKEGQKGGTCRRQMRLFRHLRYILPLKDTLVFSMYISFNIEFNI